MTRFSLSVSLLGAALLADAHAQGLSNLEVIERGPHHRIVTFTRSVTDAAGQVSIHRGQYTELQMGMHYLENGEWVESQEVVEPAPFGAVAPRLSYRPSFAANLNTAGAIDLVLPDGKRLRSHLLGLRLTDLSTGRSLLIARVKDCVGEIVPPNQVWYRDAFEGLAVDVRCVASKGAFEADVVLRESPILPADFDPARTRLEVVTEFLDPPDPVVTAVVPDAQTGLTDDDLDFGTMRMILGKAFTIGADGASAGQVEAQTPVLKRWVKTDGRTLLVESLDYLSLRPLLAALPKQRGEVVAASEFKGLPSVVGAKASVEPLKLASLGGPGKGVVLDYTIVISNPNGYTFASGATYKVQSAVNLGGYVAFQSGAIIKFTDTAGLVLNRYVTTPAAGQPRAIFTSVDDNSVGEQIGSGTPTTGSFSALTLYPNPASATLRRLEFRYAGRGVMAYAPNASQLVGDCRFDLCNVGVGAYFTTITLDNLVMCQVSEWTHNYGSATFLYQESREADLTGNCEGFGLPNIVTQPQDRTINCSGTATFTVYAAGEHLTYQWYFNNVSIPGATDYKLTLVNPTPSQAGEYHLVIANAWGSVTSRRATLTVNSAPQIITQPSSQTVRVGGTATFTVQAIGSNVSYQWRFGPNDIPGATSWQYILSNVQAGHAGNYSVRVSNSCGAVTSVNALLTVVPVGQDIVYDFDADFDKGCLVNLNHTAVHHQLQINANPTPFPYLNMACSGRGTLARIDVNTGRIVGEYQTAPDINGAVIDSSPSRTTVDRWGNVWVANRNDNQLIGGAWKGSVTRIGLVIGGIRGTKSGGTFTSDPNGEYLSPPFLYNTCRDRFGTSLGDPPDGYLKTSRGLTDIRRWLNPAGQDTAGGVSTAQDEAILNYTRTICTDTRTVAVDKDNNVWVGGTDETADRNQRHQLLDGVSGQPVQPPKQFELAYGGYGGLVDGYGYLWSARWGNGLLRYNTATGAWNPLGNNCGDYGLGIDPRTQQIWYTHSIYYYVGQLSSAGTCLGWWNHGYDYAQGVVVDNQYNVWVAHSMNNGSDVGHLRTDGTTFVGNVPLGGTGVAGPTGVAVDSNGKVWASAYNQNSAVRINPTAGAVGGGGFPIGAVDLRVDLGDGSQHTFPYANLPATPYNYSDMTGFVTLGSTFPSGSWMVVHDEGVVNRQWRKLAWSATTPANSGIQVEVRAANSATQLPDQNFIPASSDVQFAPLTGRYLEIRVTLWRTPLSGANPLLDWLKVYAPQ